MTIRHRFASLVVFIPLLLVAVVAAQGQQAEPAVPAAPSGPSYHGPITVALNLGAGPATLDPALAGSASELNVVDQLFAGLVLQDERDGSIWPDLASSWAISAGGNVYTFTLRSGAIWSDGHALTAADVRYGILRTLAPETGAPLAYTLYLIENAQDYNEGQATADQVGIDVLSDTSLRFRLDGPAAHFLSVLAMWHARPQPSWVIETYGDEWTSLENIVTNGPYLLSEHQPGDYLILDKNPAYHGADEVQIERVQMWLIDDANQAWQLYLDGELDTAEVPPGTVLPPEVAGQVVKQPQPCTYYYGFSQTQEPFDDPLVRQAFSRATNRQAVVDYLGGALAPALTFAPRGVAGHVDGYAEGVGLPYDPTVAQQLLSAAGYPGGAGLPPITLWYNDLPGHHAIAGIVRDSWFDALGVTASLEARPWSEFNSLLNTGGLQVWRMGWCADYLDAFNFLHDALLARNRFGDWNNPAYEDLLDALRAEVDPVARQALFKQAEQILVESDAMMIPIYFYGSPIASKPYLARTYPAHSYHIAFWRIGTTATIDGGGGSLASYDGRALFDVPAGAFAEEVRLSHAPVSEPPYGGGRITIGRAFSLTAVISDTGQAASLAPGQSYDVAFHYDQADLGLAAEETLTLYYWDGTAWRPEASSQVDPALDVVTASPEHFSIWVVMGVRDETAITVALNLGSEPVLDPALAGDRASLLAIEQLFLGLTDIDDDSGQAVPELASNWTLSADRLQWTFTLRDDVYWSDGKLITAGDVRYGILRSLNPATNAPLAYVLDIIKNAADYRLGHIGDPGQVGVTALNSTTLRITLERPASQLPAVLATAPARPMPQWAIVSHGAGWTSPGKIVTNGPYLLHERVSGSQLSLVKNPAYYEAGEVQIEKVLLMTALDTRSAWRMYVNGQLDTAELPAGVPLDPALASEVQWQPTAASHHYGFSVSQPPFNNPLVRKAFASAIDRPALAAYALNGAIREALTYTPPGFQGYVDGYAQGIGYPYNPTQAQQYLADAGYPGGAGLPPITLWFNNLPLHRAMAQFIRDGWLETLGVEVTLSSLPWDEYVAFIGTGAAQVFRMGWAADYQDAYNFMADGMSARNRYGDWQNAAYDDLLDQAAWETGALARADRFAQAEEILVESDAVIAPLYHTGARIAARAYLTRAYSPMVNDIAQWRIASTATADPVEGGELTSYDGKTTISAPGGVFSETAVISHRPLATGPGFGSLVSAGRAFEMSAHYEKSGKPAVPQDAYHLVVRYSDADLGLAMESTLALHYWNGSRWVKEPSSALDAANNRVTAAPNHFSIWAVLGETSRVYLPLMLR